MSITMILLKQIITMFLLAAIGFLLYKARLVTDGASKGLGNILIYTSLPAVIIKGFLVERTPERMMGLLISAILAFVILALFSIISKLVFRKDGIAVFASSFSNPGFFGVPLIAASISDGAIFYVAAFIGFLNMFQWTYGVAVMTGKSGRITAKKIFTAPFFIAILVGLVLFLTALPLPGILTNVIGNVAGLNTPISMFVVGGYLAQVDFKKMLLRRENYLVSLMRLIILPVIAALLMHFIPDSYPGLKEAIFIASACPVGSNVAVYAQLYGCDHTYAAETVVISTLLSVVTIPLLITLI
ncbi:MAG: AEC family transporter [Pseudobutyrivibrio sp.]|nr:AEC family transporter [Pseudobutyrivibrio sp.]